MISKYLKTSNLTSNITLQFSDEELNYSESGVWPLKQLNRIHSYYQVDDYFSLLEINEIINLCGKLERIKGQTYNKDKPIESLYRISEISWIPINKFTYSLYQKINRLILDVNESFYKFDLLSLERLQFTRYNSNVSGLYNKHLDCGTLNDYNIDRKLSMVMQLSDPDDYSGGDLVLHCSQDPSVVEKKQGRIVFFPSHILHEVTPITSGNRLSLVSWISGPALR